MPWQWLPIDSANPASALEPWSSFANAKRLIDSGNSSAAIRTLKSVIDTPNQESRIYLQAWHFLRELGIDPAPAQAKNLLGVVVEVAMPKGLDMLAAWPDHHARYYNFSGAAVIWERPKDSLDKAIDDLLAAGLPVLRSIGPWKGKRPAAPMQPNTVRINLLAPAGLCYGEGPMNVLSRDAMAGPVIASATRLMMALMALTKK